MLFRKKTGKNKFEFKFSTEMLAVSVDDTAQTALELIRSSKLTGNIFYCYVTDKEGKLVGIARANDFIEDTIAIEEKTEHERDDLLKIIGIQLEEFRKPTIFKSTFLRFPFLLFNISSGLICAFITKHFDRTIEEFIFIAFFITIILGLAESIGTQAVAVALSYLDKTIKLRKLVIYEVLVGAKMGLLCGGLLYLVSFFWIGNYSFSLTFS